MVVVSRVAHAARTRVWWVVVWRPVVRWTMWAMVVVIVVIVIWISTSPTPIVWVVPTIIPAISVRSVPIVEWIVPAIIPTIRRQCYCAPRAEHRGYILWLDPHHIARNHNVVECRVVCRSIEECIRISQRVVRRRHTVGWRREGVQTTSVCALV